MEADLAVGVVIPVRDSERWLGEAIASVLGQTRPPADVVVVDDGSEDASARIAEGFGEPVRILGQSPAGIGAARNRGIDEVRGDLLAFLDADDLWIQTKLQSQSEAMRARPDLDLVFGQARQFSRLDAGRPVPIDDLQPCHLCQAMLIRRSAFERVGSFDVSTKVSEMLDWLLRARELGLTEETLAEQVLWRRVHDRNHSWRHRGSRGEFARTLKASLDRRRAR